MLFNLNAMIIIGLYINFTTNVTLTSEDPVANVNITINDINTYTDDIRYISVEACHTLVPSGELCTQAEVTVIDNDSELCIHLV